MVDSPRVIIIGAGFAGLSAVKALAKTDAEVVLFDKQNHHLFQPLLYQVATAALHSSTIAAPIRTIFRKQLNTTVVMKEVEGIDVRHQEIIVGGESYYFDYLIVAAGLETNYFGNEAWKKYAPGMKTIREAVDIRGRFLLAFEQAEIEDDPAAKKAALTFAIVGAGPTGVEMVGALAEVTDSIRKDFRWFDSKSSRIVLIDYADRILSSFHPELSAKAEEDLYSMGVEILLQTRVTSVDQDGLTAESKNGEMRIETNNVIWAAGVKGSALGSDLDVECDNSGRVFVEPDLSIKGHPNIFVVGDLAHINDGEFGPTVPAVAQGAIQGGKYVGKIIATELESKQHGRPPKKRRPFRYSDRGSMAIIGRNRAVAEVGRFRFSGYFAFLLWAFIHILFLIGFRRKAVAFIEWVWLYCTGGRGSRLITGADHSPAIKRQPQDTKTSQVKTSEYDATQKNILTKHCQVKDE